MTDETRETAEYIPFEEFRNGLPHGRFRVIVNPKLAAPFVTHRTHATPIAIALIGPGIAAALAGYPWAGAALVAAGVLLRRVVKVQAARICGEVGIPMVLAAGGRPDVVRDILKGETVGTLFI